ncbi:hypothetical protein Tco_1063991 [Tanacetum coccineum]
MIINCFLAVSSLSGLLSFFPVSFMSLLYFLFGVISGSEPGEMALESLQAVFKRLEEEILLNRSSCDTGCHALEAHIFVTISPHITVKMTLLAWLNLLCMCGLTTACRHPELAYNIKDRDRNVIDMDAFLKLPVWTKTIVSKGDPIPKDQLPKLYTTLPLANLVKLQAKHAGEGASEAPRKKRKVRKNQEPNHSCLEDTLSPIPLHHAAPNNAEGTATATPVGPIGDATNVEREVVDLSGNTRVSTLPSIVIQPLPHPEHIDSDAHSFHSSYHEGIEDGLEDHQFVPNWGLRDDLRICTFRACKELVTPAEEEFLGNFTNVEIKSLEEALVPKSKQLVTVEERIKVLESEKSALEAGLCFTTDWLGGLSLGQTKEQIATMLSETQDLDIECSKS